uniref:Uncharacterized protein n=1 Tax=Oryza nivara TaxID=4536 RepID=A0A0E0GQG1_ORYNI
MAKKRGKRKTMLRRKAPRPPSVATKDPNPPDRQGAHGLMRCAHKESGSGSRGLGCMMHLRPGKGGRWIYHRIHLFFYGNTNI